MVIGCDLAKHSDWTVLVAMDAATGRCFAMERFNTIDWPVQKDRIVAFVRRHPGKLVLDATGVGDAMYDGLKRVLPDVEPFVITQAAKVDLVQRLSVAIEQREVSWPGTGHMVQGSGFRGQEAGSGEWETLTNELKRFEYKILSSGRITYSAPSGYYDDCVTALMLANYARCRYGATGTMARMLVGQPGWGVRPRHGWSERAREWVGTGL